MTDLDIEIRRLRIEPGDVLVVRVNGAFTACTADRIKTSIAGVVGEHVPVMVVGPEIDLALISPKDVVKEHRPIERIIDLGVSRG
jgi:hypothetical protein